MVKKPTPSAREQVAHGANIATILQIIGPGIAWVGTAMSQNIPVISAYGWFGAFCIGLVLWLVFCLSAFLWSLARKDKPQANSRKRPSWKAWLILGFCIVGGFLLIERRPSLPPGMEPSIIDLPIATYAEMDKDVITGKTIILSQFPRVPKHPMVIRGKRFENCLILGPSVISIKPSTKLLNNTLGMLEGDPESILLETKTDNLTAVIVVDDCTFYMCRFRGICFVGPASLLNILRKLPYMKDPNEP